MKLTSPFGSAFRRATSFFPAPVVVVQIGVDTCQPDGFCAVSFDPAVVALTFAGKYLLPDDELVVSSPSGVTLRCKSIETREIGDHTLLFAEVQKVELCSGVPSVTWRRATFPLRLDYPFLECAQTLETFVRDWHAGTLAKNAWTHAAHVAVTGYHAFNSTSARVFAEMKRGILHFNQCTGTVNGPDSGYHETLTHFWSDTISHFVGAAKPQSRLDAAICAVRRFGEDRDFATLFYSFDVLRDQRARREVVLPDLQPSPEWCGL